MAAPVEVYLANDEEWQSYKLKFKKAYLPEEEPAKLVIAFFFFYLLK